MKLLINWFISPVRGVLYGDIVSRYIRLPNGKYIMNQNNTYTYMKDIKIVDIKYNNNIIIFSTNDVKYILHPNKMDNFIYKNYLNDQKNLLLKFGLPKDYLKVLSSIK